MSGIDVGPFRYIPQSTNVFRRKESIYVVYDLYNVTPQLLESPPGPRVFLMLGGKPLEEPPFRRYEVFPSAEKNALSYVAILDAGALAPGEYNLVVVVPNSENVISRRFTVAGQ